MPRKIKGAPKWACNVQVVPWMGWSVMGALHVFCFSTLCVLGMYCYLLCVLADPGSVPRHYQHDLEDVTAMYIQVRSSVPALRRQLCKSLWTASLHSMDRCVQVKKKGGTARWCQKCNRAKPPRAHHCRMCGRCVLRMDHHCPWVNNCVGHGNYKAFLLFLFCASHNQLFPLQ